MAAKTNLSRTGVSNPLGKLDGEIKKFRVPGITEDEVLRLSREADMTVAEWMRNLVMIRVHGIDMVSTVQAQRLAVVAGNGIHKGGED